MLFKRSLFFVVVVSLMLLGAIFGTAGGYAVGERLLGEAVMNARPYYMTSWITWVELALLSVGALIGFLWCAHIASVSSLFLLSDRPRSFFVAA